MASFDSTNSRMDAPPSHSGDSGHAISLSQEANSLHQPMAAHTSPAGGGEQGMSGAGGSGSGKGGDAYGGRGGGIDAPPAAPLAGGSDGGGFDDGGKGGKGGRSDAGPPPANRIGADQNGADRATGDRPSGAHASQPYVNGGQGYSDGSAPSRDVSQAQVDQINAGFGNTADLYASNAGGASKSGTDSSAQSDAIRDAGKDVGGDSTGDPHRDRAREILSGAAHAERTVTPDMQALADANGGKMVGLDHRLKSEDSLTRKLGDENINDVSDALRYTMSMPGDKLADGANKVMDQMEAQGYQKDKVKNTFPGDSTYKGINTSFSKDGQKFELQFHTPESLAAKEQTHGPYEVNRELVQKDGQGNESWKSPEQLAKVADKYAHYLAPHPELAAHGRELSAAGKAGSPDAEKIADKLSQAIADKCEDISRAIPTPDNIESVTDYRRGKR